MNSKDFIEWIEKNRIDYDRKNTDLMNALFGEYAIEK